MVTYTVYETVTSKFGLLLADIFEIADISLFVMCPKVLYS